MVAGDGGAETNNNYDPEKSISRNVAVFLAAIPQEGIIIHGAKLDYSLDRQVYGIHHPSNVYTYVPKPDDVKLHDLKFIRGFVGMLRRETTYSAHVSTSGETGIGYINRFRQLSGEYPNGSVPASVFFDGEGGRKLLPELIVAKAPQSLYREYVDTGSKYDHCAIGADRHPVPSENFLASVSLSPEEFQSTFLPDELLVNKMVNTLVELWRSETDTQKAPLLKKLVSILKNKLHKVSLAIVRDKYPVRMDY